MPTLSELSVCNGGGGGGGLYAVFDVRAEKSCHGGFTVSGGRGRGFWSRGINLWRLGPRPKGIRFLAWVKISYFIINCKLIISI